MGEYSEQDVMVNPIPYPFTHPCTHAAGTTHSSSRDSFNRPCRHHGSNSERRTISSCMVILDVCTCQTTTPPANICHVQIHVTSLGRRPAAPRTSEASLDSCPHRDPLSDRSCKSPPGPGEPTNLQKVRKGAHALVYHRLAVHRSVWPGDFAST